MERASGKPVLIAARGLDAVGTGRQVELLASGLAAAGWNVHLACMTTGGSLADRLAAAGITVHRIGGRPVADVATGLRLFRLARRLMPAVVLSFGRRQAVLAATVGAALPGVRTCGHVAVPVRGLSAGWSLRRLDRVIATSPGVAASCRRLGVAADRIVVNPPGITVAESPRRSRAEIASSLGLDPAAEWTLCVTPLVAESRLERLLWGIDQLGVVRKGLQHVLVGAGPQAARVGRRARVQELAERLFVFRSCGMLPDLLHEVRFAWQPGSVAIGGAILDAMAAGVPTVAVDGDAARQLIDNGRTGWIVPPLPESEFPRRAFNILEDADMAARFAAAARGRAVAEFPADRMVAAFAAELVKLASLAG
jgi:glycosyltransferase involved in cell wall biosynthesis